VKRAFLCSSCCALAPVLNEFIVSAAFGDVDYSSNVGSAPVFRWPPVAADPRSLDRYEDVYLGDVPKCWSIRDLPGYGLIFSLTCL